MRLHEFHEVILKGKLVEVVRYKHQGGPKILKGVVKSCKTDGDGVSHLSITLANKSFREIKVGSISKFKILPEGDRMFFSLENDVSV